jgi:CRISPR-associated protein Cmr2
MFGQVLSPPAQVLLLTQTMWDERRKTAAISGGRRRREDLCYRRALTEDPETLERRFNRFRAYYSYIAEQLALISSLGLLAGTPDASLLPPYAFTLAFPFRLAKPYRSGGDEELYLHENPVAKDKVFKVPLVTPATWKGNLRWTAMKRLVDRCGAQSGQPDIENYAHERFCLSRLFGDEKGDEPGKPTDVADYLDRMCPARTSDEDETRNGESFREKCDATGPCPYRMKMREHFEVEGSVASQPGERPPVPHHAGRVHLYPTFFDNIGLEVINPHKRATRAGTKPIYLETVPKGSIGWFRLLYYPHDLIGRDDGYVRRQVAEDLELLAAPVKETLLTYGFGAKKTSGFGLAMDTLPKKRDRGTLPKGALIVNAPGKPQSAEFGRVSEMVDTAKGIAQQLKQGAT